MYIDTTSYTNKDFRSIWPELLELVTDLTDKWDPNNSNESDVGVAMLKLKAFIADKLNYNIDKNTLEAFPSSVTQRGNAQKIYDAAGYELQWYKSATTSVLFKFVNPQDDRIELDPQNPVQFTIPRFAQLTNPDNSVIYTTLSSTKLDTNNNNTTDPAFAIDAIEGSVETFTINGIDTITINNLDADYRLYFTESMIASNGIFINNVGVDEFWQPTFNLESTQLGKQVFKFGVMPNSNQCYIEFPQDAAELFGQGINIHYVISSGAAGNIKRATLTTFAEEYPDAGILALSDGSTEKYSLSKYIRVTNPNGTNNGSDPESLESAYKNYQRTVNTFSTLVTLLDYTNAIYNQGAVSNCVITDRTTDFNTSYKVKSKNLMGQTDIHMSNPDLKLNAFNLCVYVLNKVANVYDKDTYDKTFETSSISERDAIESIANYKSVQHDWVSLFTGNTQNAKAYLFKNLINISGQVITYSKVSTTEAKDIIKNIQEALYVRYQSRNIDFGADLNYEDVRNTIINADTRVKDIVLNDFDYNLGLMRNNNRWYSLTNPTEAEQDITTLESLCTEIVAKSILAGYTPLFIFDNAITYSYQMDNIGKYELITSGSPLSSQILYNSNTEEISTNQNPAPSTSDFVDEPYTDIAAITTQAKITIPKDSSYTIQTNETVFFYRPSYISKAQVGTYFYVAFKLEPKEDVTDGIYIRKDELYQLKNEEWLCCYESKDYLGETAELKPKEGIPLTRDDRLQDVKKLYTYGPGTIIKPNFDVIYATDKSGCVNFKLEPYNNKQFLTSFINLQSDKTIDIMDANATQINRKSVDQDDTKTVYCTWIVDDINNRLFNNLDKQLAEAAYVEWLRLSEEEQKKQKVYIEHILQNNEVFLYTDASKSDLILCQSGVRVKMPYTAGADYDNNWRLPKPDLAELNSEGVTDNTELKEIPRNVIYFEVEELQIETLGAGVTLKNASTNTLVLDNIARLITDAPAISWEVDSDEYYLPAISLNDSNVNVGWKGFSRLSVFSTPQSVFELKRNLQGTAYSDQTVILFKLLTEEDENGALYNIYNPAAALGPGQSFSTSSILVTSGGIKQNVQVINDDETINNLIFVAYKYNPIEKDSEQNLWQISNNNSTDYTLDVSLTEGNAYQTRITNKATNAKLNLDLTINLSSLFKSNGTFGTIIPIIFTYDGDYDSASITTQNLDLIGYEAADKPTKMPLQKLLSFNYNPNNGNSFSIKLTGLDTSKTLMITLYQPQKVDLVNTFENPFATINNAATLPVLEAVNSLATERDSSNAAINNFDYSYIVPEDEQILNPLDPISFYDTNHICNNITISQIDKINIIIARQSKH